VAGRTIVIIGGGAAGASAAARARRLDPEARVVILEAGEFITHAPCGVPYAISGVVKSYEELREYTAEQFAKERGIEVLINARVAEIDVDKRVVKYVRGGREESITWDRLIIATGAKPIVPNIPGVDAGNVLTLRKPEDVPRLVEVLGKASRVVVVGAGYIGVEVAENLVRMGKRVTVIDRNPQPLANYLDEDMGKLVAEEMASHGVELRMGEELQELKVVDGLARRVVTSGGEYEADAVVLAMGVVPDTDIAARAGIRLGERGAIAVNEYMETNVPDVYAAGDAVEKYHRVLNRKVWIPLAPYANKEGQVAGANAVKGRVLRFPGIVGSAVTKFGELYIGRTGLTLAEARAAGFNAEAVTVKHRTKARYYPGAQTVHVKLVYEQGSGRVLGMQFVGYDDAVAGYVDAAAIAIENEYTIEDLFFADISYMPATSPVWHPIVVAARVASRGRF